MKNGNYGGFSVDDQSLFINWAGHSVGCESYHFKNVIQLSHDYDKGFWDNVFKYKVPL